MLTNINPKLPMRDKTATKDFYVNKLGFQNFGSTDFDGYLMVEKDNIQIHFFEFKDLDPKENYGQAYIRTDDIDNLYQSLLDNKVNIHPNGALQTKPKKNQITVAIAIQMKLCNMVDITFFFFTIPP